MRSAAVTVALPFLPSALWSRRAGAAACQPPRRFMAWFVPNGFNMPDWTPASTGTSWAATPISQPLESIRGKVLILTGLDMQTTAAPAYPPGDNVAGTGSFLNMIPVNGHTNDPTRVSLDQALLPALNPVGCAQPRFPSLQIGVQGQNGLCDGVDCGFARAISWRDGIALPNVTDPALLFDKLFAGTEAAASAAAVASRRAQRTSVLDRVLADAGSTAARLSRSDKIKMDEFMTSVRALELELQASPSGGGGSSCSPPVRPPASPPNNTPGRTPGAVIQQNVPNFLALMKLAFQCDLTRAITFMMGNAGSNNDYGFLVGGGVAPHHSLSQHNGGATQLAKLTTIDTWEILQLATLLKSLDDIKEIDGASILDHTTFYLGSDVGDGLAENHWDQPVLLAGGASGKMRIDGRHLNYIPSMPFPRPLVGPRGGPHTGRVFLSILAAHGLPSDQFGEATVGPLPELLV